MNSSQNTKNYVGINDINHSNYGKTVRVRISRMWTAINPNYNTIISRDMILIDEKENQIHGRLMTKEMKPEFEEILKEGEIVEISRFGSSIVKKQWRVTTHDYQLYINKDSDVQPTTNEYNIPTHRFNFFDYTRNSSLASRSSNEFLTDVVGRITCWSTIKKTTVKNKIAEQREITIENDKGANLDIILENEFAYQVRDEDIDESAKQPILIINLGIVKYNKTKGQYFINSFSTTGAYLNLQIPETASFMASAPENNLEITEAIQPSQSDLEDMIFENRRTLTEINASREKNINNKPNDYAEIYQCQASIYKIYDHWDWCYQGCKECRKIVKSDMYGGFICTSCGKRTTTPHYICKLNAEIEDGVTTTKITLFGNHLKSLLDTPVEDILNKSKDLGKTNALNELRKLINKKALFEVKIDKYNFTNKRSFLTTTKILPIDPVMEEKYTSRKREREEQNNNDEEQQGPPKKSSEII